MKFKKAFILLPFLIFSRPAFSQESDLTVSPETEIEISAEIEAELLSEEENQADENAVSDELENSEYEEEEVTFDLKKNAFFLNFGPVIMINTDDKTESAPSPIKYSFGFGCDFRQDKTVSGQVRLLFFTNYYLWDGENAQPAEIENRTATAFSFMIDGLVGHSWKFGLNQLNLSGGIGVLARFAIQSSGVEEKTEEVTSINSWFYSNLNFLYPEIAFTYLRSIPSVLGKAMVGVEGRTYFSIGGLFADGFFDGVIFSFAVKFQF